MRGTTHGCHDGDGQKAPQCDRACASPAVRPFVALSITTVGPIQDGRRNSQSGSKPTTDPCTSWGKRVRPRRHRVVGNGGDGSKYGSDHLMSKTCPKTRQKNASPQFTYYSQQSFDQQDLVDRLAVTPTPVHQGRARNPNFRICIGAISAQGGVKCPPGQWHPTGSPSNISSMLSQFRQPKNP